MAQAQCSGYDPELDSARLTRKYNKLFAYMSKQRGYKTLREISSALLYPEATVSAMMRYFRREIAGAHTVLKQRRGEPRNGLWEYQLIVNAA